MPHYYVERLGRANHHLPFHCLHAGVQSAWLSRTLTVVLFQSGGQFILALQLHH